MENREEFKSAAEQAVTLTEETRKHRKPRKRRKKAISHISELNNKGLRRLIEEYSRELTRKLAIYTYAVIALVSFTFMLVTMCSVGYEGFVDNRSVGVARTKEHIEEIKHSLNEEIIVLGGTEEGQIGKIDYRFKIVSEENYTSDEQIRKNLVFHSDAMLNGCGIYVDGVCRVILKSEGDAKIVLERIKNQYNAEGMECTSEILNQIELKSEETTYSESSTVDEAIKALNDVTESTRDYTVKAGDSLWGIAHEHDMNLYDFLDMNPQVGDVIKVGDVLNVPAPKPVVDVKTVIRGAVLEEAIEAELVEVPDASLYIGQSRITDYGTDGWHKITADITRINGVEDPEMRVVLKDEVLSEPIPGKISIGTTPVPRGVGSGSFRWPVSGFTISSRFGPRWGSVHTGLDMALATGNPVRACDEGVVVFAGWNKGGYGNLIKVDHKNGYQTWYAHLSKIYVRNGEVVAKGETIGAVGNTGFSTGPHLHLEIRKNGVAKNPINYLP